MKMGNGPCRIGGVEVGELQVNFFAPTPLLTAKYAYVDATSETVPLRVGSSHKNQWGGAVMQKLAELQSAMEEEIVSELFEGGVTTDGGNQDEKPQEDQLDSL